MYITTSVFNNQIAEPISAAAIESSYEQIENKRYELGLIDGQGFTFMEKRNADSVYTARSPWAASITATEVASWNTGKAADVATFASSINYQAQRKAWNTQQAAQAFVDFINQLNSPAWSATYDGLDESVQIQG